ncbi:ependymin-1-like [Channa argus]|uniref:ependymin-1-like n=1 Tax=Channa argus TaxID=215402 RepID=UPI0035214C0C
MMLLRLKHKPGRRLSPRACVAVYKKQLPSPAQCLWLPANSCVESRNMRLFIALTCLLAGCLAQKPQPCRSPPLMSGALTVSTQNEKLLNYVLYLYDAVGQRIRLWEQGSYENKTFISDYLLHYREGVLYDIVDSNRTCKKVPLKGDFQPLGIPKTASLLSQAVIGSSSGPGEGLLINIWTGDLPEKAGKYISTVTEFGCIPVSTLYHTDQFGWVVVSFFNNIVGISDPSLLNAPNFCPQAEVDPEKEQKDFLSLFLMKN